MILDTYFYFLTETNTFVHILIRNIVWWKQYLSNTFHYLTNGINTFFISLPHHHPYLVPFFSDSTSRSARPLVWLYKYTEVAPRPDVPATTLSGALIVVLICSQHRHTPPHTATRRTQGDILTCSNLYVNVQTSAGVVTATYAHNFRLSKL